MKVKFWGNEPKKAHPTDAAWDLVAAEDMTVPAEQWEIVKTGTHIALPPGYVGYVCSRSGLALKWGVSVKNAPGVIDATYTGDVGVILENQGTQPFKVQKGDRIAQLIIDKLPDVTLVRSDPERGERGDNGFGSTGV